MRRYQLSTSTDTVWQYRLSYLRYNGTVSDGCRQCRHLSKRVQYINKTNENILRSHPARELYASLTTIKRTASQSRRTREIQPSHTGIVRRSLKLPRRWYQRPVVHAIIKPNYAAGTNAPRIFIIFRSSPHHPSLAARVAD